MNNSEFLRMLQQFETYEAIGPTSLRNQQQGLLETVRHHLGDVLDLGRVPISREGFHRWLDHTTDCILAALPGRTDEPPWGTVRKGINLFLRGCVLNHYLRQAYRLDRIEPWLEIPLDSVVAGALKHAAGRGALPVWPGLKRLTRQEGVRFQAFAQQYAKQLGFRSLAHLDIHLMMLSRERERPHTH